MSHSHRTILNVVEQMLAKDTSNYIFSYAGDRQKEGSFIFHDNKCQLHRPLTLETPEPITNIQIEEHIKDEALSYYKDKISLSIIFLRQISLHLLQTYPSMCQTKLNETTLYVSESLRSYY